MREQSIRAFASTCGVNYRRLAVWLQGNSAPDAENLRRISTSGVSVDWLLDIPDAPMMRDSSRSQATLEIDLSSHVRRELRGQGIGDEATSLLNPSALLDVVTGVAKRYLEPYQLLRAAHDAMLESENALYEEHLPHRKRVDLIRKLDAAGKGLFDVFDSLPAPSEAGVLNVVARKIRKPKAARKSRQATVKRSPATSKRASTKRRKS